MEKLVYAPPLKGFIDGIDPASPLFPEEGSPDLENIRTGATLWSTRLGMALWQTLGGSGAVRFPGNYFKSDGTTRRLAVRGATLYESSGGAFSAATGGTGFHATNPVHGAILRDYLYLVDGNGSLRRYNTAGVSGVAQPAAPGAAPKADSQMYGTLEDWSSVGSWTSSAPANFTLTDATASFSDAPPLGAKVAQIHWTSGGAKNATLTRNVASEALNSHFIALYVQGEKAKPRVNFEIGINAAGDFPNPLKCTEKNEWSIFFVPVADLPSISFKRFRCVKPDGGGNLYLSPLFLPGYLQGKYRWRYTHYNATTGAESKPSPATEFLDFSAVGKNGAEETSKALQKSAKLTLTSDGTSAATDKVRIYRNGGAPSLTSDSYGQDVWTLVAEVSDTGTVAGDTFTYIDNTADEKLAGAIRLDLERDDAPAGAQWISVAPDERLWLFLPSGQVCVSNRRTPERRNDHEVFPDGVDPYTRGSLLQGWRFYVGGEAGGDQIVWGGFFQGVPTVLTRKALYQIHAYSQAEWGPTTVQKVLDVGCLAGETVQEVNGTLVWVTDGPRVVRWNGGGEPLDLSYQRVSTTLQNAPAAYWSQWFARAHADQRGAHYRLYLTPSGATTNTLRLDYNIVGDVWEPVVYYNGSAVAYAWTDALVWSGASDHKELYAASGATVYQQETGSTDAGAAIRIRFKTPKRPLGSVAQAESLYLRLAAVSDGLTVSVTLGGSEYRLRSGVTDTGDPTAAYAVTLSGTGDEEFKTRLAYTVLKGRWAQLQISGSVLNRPEVRDAHLYYQPVREGRIS